MKQNFHNIFVTKYFATNYETKLSQHSLTNFRNILSQNFHNILWQTLKWQIINRCINEVSQQSISVLNYSTSLLQYLHLNYWVTDSSSDYETVMKQFFITKHLITKHLITTSTNWVTDISSNSSSNSSPHSSPQYFHNNFIQIWRIYFITNFNELFLRNIYVIVLRISSTQLHSQTLYHKV